MSQEGCEEVAERGREGECRSTQFSAHSAAICVEAPNADGAIPTCSATIQGGGHILLRTVKV